MHEPDGKRRAQKAMKMNGTHVLIAVMIFSDSSLVYSIHSYRCVCEAWSFDPTALSSLSSLRHIVITRMHGSLALTHLPLQLLQLVIDRRQGARLAAAAVRARGAAGRRAVFQLVQSRRDALLA